MIHGKVECSGCDVLRLPEDVVDGVCHTCRGLRIGKTILITVMSGMVVTVEGLPEGWTYAIEDHDIEEED